MSKTITLPDHISFEEIALKWCNLPRGGWRSIILTENLARPPVIRYEFVGCSIILKDFIGKSVVAYFVPSYRRNRILLLNKKEFQPILDYIKERSNGQN